MKPKVFVTRPLPAPALELLSSACEVRSYAEDAAIPVSQLAAECREVEGILVNSARVNEEVLLAAPKLRAISNCGVGYDNIDVAACNRRRIPITNLAGSLEESTADLAFTLLLATARRAIEADRYVREGRWDRWQSGLLHGMDVHHKTLGLVGFGGIGQPMARRGLGFSMRILYHTRHRADESVERELQAGHADLETLLRESDYVSLHVPLTSETRHIIDRKALGLMKNTAILVNTARGPVVDEEALVEALTNRKIAGAGLDVFDGEPNVNPNFAALDNVVLAPHIGSATGETRLRMAMLAVRNLLAMLEGERPANVVNPEVYS
ncbi:MAG: D-glycerate dehydrogenase [Terriglobia bacterium]